jgi:hypothetical protein
MAEGTESFDRPRDRHLFARGPKRLLSLDGGGVRGALTVAFLERIEQLLRDHHKQIAGAGPTAAGSPPGEQQVADAEVRLGDWFDLIGGTSTGALIAGALALGVQTDDVKDFYLERAPRAFRRRFLGIPFLQPKFDARGLRAEIEDIVGGETLDSAKLITGFAVIAKRIDTGSPWIVANNRNSVYWEASATHIGNKDYKLSTLVRASTAAPLYFDPEILAIKEDAPQDTLGNVTAHVSGLPWLSLLVTKVRALYGLVSKHGPSDKTHGLFIDGGVTPYNNPAMALLMMAVLKQFGIGWQLGPQNLTIVSIGTGSYRTKLSFQELGFAGPLKLAKRAMFSFMGDSQSLALSQMQWLGESPLRWPINREVKALEGNSPPGGPWFRFLRYDVRLEPDWLLENLDMKVTEREALRLQQMDDLGTIAPLYQIGRLAAERQVKAEHLFPGTEGVAPTAL